MGHASSPVVIAVGATHAPDEQVVLDLSPVNCPCWPRFIVSVVARVRVLSTARRCAGGCNVELCTATSATAQPQSTEQPLEVGDTCVACTLASYWLAS